MKKNNTKAVLILDDSSTQLEKCKELDYYPTFNEAQKLIGGYLQELKFGDCYIYCDEDGLPKKLTCNSIAKAMTHIPFVGKVLITDKRLK